MQWLDSAGAEFAKTEQETITLRNIAYFDLETQKTADEVGGWSKADKMRVSVAVIFSTALDDFIVYQERDVFKLVDELAKADLVVGFNVKGFDYAVLKPYSPTDLRKIPTLDMLDDVKRVVGHRLSLDALAECTLGVGKSADGLKAVEWYRQGQIEPIIEYCKQDVAVTRDLYRFGCENGHISFRNRRGVIQRVPVGWKP